MSSSWHKMLRHPPQPLRCSSGTERHHYVTHRCYVVESACCVPSTYCLHLSLTITNNRSLLFIPHRSARGSINAPSTATYLEIVSFLLCQDFRGVKNSLWVRGMKQMSDTSGGAMYRLTDAPTWTEELFRGGKVLIWLRDWLEGVQWKVWREGLVGV